MKRPSHSQPADPWLSFKKKIFPFESNCPAWGWRRRVWGGGDGGGSPTPGSLSVTSQLTEVNVHSSQLSRTCDGGKGKQRSTKVSSLTNMEPLKGLIGLWKKLRQQKWADVQRHSKLSLVAAVFGLFAPLDIAERTNAVYVFCTSKFMLCHK